jgi:hypothetical protein
MYLINETYLKNRVNISQHKEAKDIKIALENVNDFYMKDLLSIPLFELFLDHVENETSITDIQAELFNKVKVYNALMVQYELMYDLFDITNKGNQENADSPSIEIVKMKRGEVYSKAEQMKSNILDYLNANRAEFPQYFSNDVETGTSPKITSNGSPIVFLDDPKIWIGG